ncbi:hypothetical protein CGRA01v4_11419 [Colletotrichum graminicola]|nr:hypothetical protein CGRA01v4_11419 [Colletotrichum graminicola]
MLGGVVQDPSPPDDLVPSSLNPLPPSDVTTAPTSVVYPSPSVNRTSADNRGGRDKTGRRRESISFLIFSYFARRWLLLRAASWVTEL